MIKILAIDDKQNNLVVLTALLSSSFPDARIITAVSGREGIEKALTESPDVILLDLVMPIMGGIETCKRLKEDNFLKRIPVIMIAATKTDSKTRTKALETGVEAFLSKPIDEAELTAQVSSMIRLKESENQVLLKNERLEERKRAETEQRKITERLSLACRAGGVGIWELDVVNNILIWDDQMFNLYGIKPDKFSGNYEAWLAGVHPEDLKKSEEELQIAMRGEKDFDTEFRVVWFDGTIHSIRALATVQRDASGQAINLVGTNYDITDRKRSEETIIQERRMLRTLIDNLLDMIYVKDIDCRKVIANVSDVKNIGYEREEEVLGKTDLELFPGQTGQRGYADDMEVINSGKAIIGREEDFVNSNGARRWLLTAKIPLRDKDGKITGLVGIGHDITERKREEEELKQSYTFSESLLKTIPFGMGIVDEDGTVLFQSDNFERLFGKEAIGKKCWELYRDDKIQCTDCPLICGITIGETDAYESAGVLGNRFFEISHTGMMYKGKKAMFEIFQDITDRKENEEELIRAKEKAEESDKLKTAFLHNISHEIRTPMNAIIGFSNLLSEPDIDSSTRHSYIDMIMKSSNHLLSIITDIIDISNIEANIVKITRNGIILNSIIRSLYEQFIPKANEKKITMVSEPGLPDEESIILTDSTKLIKIISNLLNNALKFTQQGQIKFGYAVKDKLLEFFVSDTGLGIPEEYHQRIFDRFYQVDNTISKLYEGTGLGLAICKAYVERLGGEIRLSSTPGVGSTFYFTLPFEKPANTVITTPSPKKETGFVFPEKKKILVAEDIDSNFKLIGYFLFGANVDVIRASNGKEAVEKCLSDQSIDLVLMDIKMPVMDGYTAVKLIRESRPDIPIIAQTAYADDRYRAIECGCTGFISKPFDKKTLLNVISEFI